MKYTTEFASIFWSMITQYNNAKDENLKNDNIFHFRYYKKWTDQSPSMISKKALQIAEGLNLCQFQWKHRNKAGKDSKGCSLLLF